MELPKIIINLELSEHDAIRLLWLVQREAVTGQTYAQYWSDLAGNIRGQIEQDSRQAREVTVTYAPWLENSLGPISVEMMTQK